MIRQLFFFFQFKSVKEEDEEDIDEDDVDDEELAQLVAMANGLTDSETETESELDVTDRQSAVGAESLSEASTNTPYSNVSVKPQGRFTRQKIVACDL